MTAPTISCRQRFLSDLTALTETWEGASYTWTEGFLTAVNPGDITPDILHGDILEIELVCDAGAGAIELGAYYNSNNLGISTNAYPKLLVRFKTSAASAGVQALVVAEYSDASTETIIAEQYSDTWKEATGTFTASKTLDHIRLYAYKPTGTNDGTYYVYYDFVMVFIGPWTFPFVAPGGVHYEPSYKLVEMEIPGRDGDIHQKLGMKSPVITLEGHMDTDSDWGTLPGDDLYRIIRGKIGDYDTPWNWFTSDVVNCKVVPDTNPFSIGQDSRSGSQRVYRLRFKQFSYSSLGEADWDNLAWAGYDQS